MALYPRPHTALRPHNVIANTKGRVVCSNPGEELNEKIREVTDYNIFPLLSLVRFVPNGISFVLKTKIIVLSVNEDKQINHL